MRTMEFARARAREYRELIGKDAAGLLDRLARYLIDIAKVDLVAMNATQLAGSSGEIDAASGVLKYDDALSDPEKLLLFAHELGHLALHKRLTDPSRPIDPVMASAYGEVGPAAIARYSPRTYEEAQASAFALEFVCPSLPLWEAWNNDKAATTATLAERFNCSTNIVRVQLAHALHSIALGGPRSVMRAAIPFNGRQLEAARSLGRPTIVDAGPGTGKTATVIRRIQFVLEEQGARPEHILALTFSNEAAQELTERVAAAFDPETADAMTIRTFHGFGMEFLHSHGHRVGYTEDFSLLDEDAQAELVNSILGRVQCDHLITLRAPFDTATRAIEFINYCKHRLIDADALEKALSAWKPSIDERLDYASAVEFIGLFREYEAAKNAGQRIDFADLIALPIRVLESSGDVQAIYKAKFPWVIVDEFQDVTRATSRLLRGLCGESNPPWVVGDARQAIYQFLGAAPENVRDFKKDFPDAETFDLDVNYRSSLPIVTAANQLATLLEQPTASAKDLRERWRPGGPATQLGDPAVAIAEAASDAAEARGVAEQIDAWIKGDGVAAGDIAVLARRHIDVRNAMLALRDRGIKAQASGLLTADGAGGDLAVILTLADAPTIAVPRLGFALGRGRWSREQINETIATLLQELRGETQAHGFPRESLAGEIMKVYLAALRDRQSGDGFAAMTSFLFDESAYLRLILAAPESAERAMTLVEIVSSLSLATAYRSTHPGTQPADSRLGFAERFRVRLTKTLPIPLAPRPRSDAVHVMTCHASKGLEFPCVVVVGQTIPGIQGNYDWIPPSLHPSASREEEQANSLLFVGVTRAKRAVVVSYPRKATAGTRGPPKKVVPLLERWESVFGIPKQEWTVGAATDLRASAGNIWGAPLPQQLKASVLDDSVCPLLTYMEVILGARFPESSRELYPSFVNMLRRALRRIAAQANQNGRAIGELAAREILEAEWPLDRYAEHPHAAMYRGLAMRMAVGFARAFQPLGVSVDLDPEIKLTSAHRPDIRLDLVAHFRQPDGKTVAIAFRPEALAASEGTINWSDLDENKRISLVLLENDTPGITPRIYSGVDGTIYDYKWSKKKTSLPTQVGKLLTQRDAFARGDFSTDTTSFQCDRCRVRASCPFWMGALPTI
jgi:superfamily I DNA/RNA helicase